MEIVLLVFLGLAVIISSVCISVRVSNNNAKKFFQSVERYLNYKGLYSEKQIKLAEYFLSFDYKNKKGALLPYISAYNYTRTLMTSIIIFPLDKITECALVQDGTMVHHNAVAPGMVGAALFGLSGAVAGITAMNRSEHVGHLSVRVFIDDISVSSLTINILTTSVKKSDPVYTQTFRTAQMVYNEFEGLVRVNQHAHAAVSAPQAAVAPKAQQSSAARDNIAANAQILEQIKQLAQMHKDGILTDAEFAEKKKLYMDKMT